MTIFTAADVRGVVFGRWDSGSAFEADRMAFRVGTDYVTTNIDPVTGARTVVATTQLTLVISGHDFAYTTSTRLGGPTAVTGVVTGMVELDDQGRVIGTATDLPQLGGGFVDDVVPKMIAGDDTVSGSSFGDELHAGNGADFVRGLDGNDTVDGGGGDDDVNGNAGDDWVFGSAGNDTVRGGQGADTVRGEGGDDGHVNGNLGDDLVFGGDGNDTVYGGQGNDSVHGDDTRIGVWGDDLVSGDLGNDSVYGGRGDDTVIGGAGDDLLSGDEGQDIAWGGAGADRFAFAKGFGHDWIGDFNGAEGDRILLAAGTAYSLTAYMDQVVIDLGGGDTLGLVGVTPGAVSSEWITFG